MTAEAPTLAAPEESAGDQRLTVLLAMAMFVLVVDTSLMNVSISNSAGGSFGLSFGLAFAGAIMLASLSLVFKQMAQDSKVLSPAEQTKVANGLEDDAEVMTNTHLEGLLAGQPPDVKAEIIRINTDARHIAMQIALAVPFFAGLLGAVNGIRMTRLRDPKPSAAAEGMLLG